MNQLRQQLKFNMQSVFACCLVLFAFLGFTQQSYGQLKPDMGVEFSQVDFNYEKAPWLNSSWGRMSIDVMMLYEMTQIDQGYINVFTKSGWHVVNLPISINDLEKQSNIVTYLNLGLGDQEIIAKLEGEELENYLLEVSTQLKEFEALVTYTKESFQEIQRGEYIPFPLKESVIWDAQGASDIELSTIILPPLIYLELKFNPDLLNTSHSLDSSANVEAAKNQCFPMSIANSLQYLKDNFDLPVPHEHKPGLKGDNSLVGQLDQFADRTASSRRSGSGTWFTPMLTGKFNYLQENGLADKLIHRYQGRGWGTPPNQALPAGDFSAAGSTALDQGSTVTFEWICEQIRQGEDVELVFSYDNSRGEATGGHAVRVYECGVDDGRPYIRYLHDRNQNNDNAGLETVKVFLEDLDNDGMLNLGSRSIEIRFALSESMRDKDSTPTPTNTSYIPPTPENTPTIDKPTPTKTATPTPRLTPTPTQTNGDDPPDAPKDCPIYFSIEEPYVLPNGASHGDILVHNPGGEAYVLTGGANQDLLKEFIPLPSEVLRIDAGLDGFDIIQLDQSVSSDEPYARHKIIFTVEKPIKVSNPNHSAYGVILNDGDLLLNNGGVILAQALFAPLQLLNRTGGVIEYLGIDAIELEGLLNIFDKLENRVIGNLKELVEISNGEAINIYFSFEEINEEYTSSSGSLLPERTIVGADDLIGIHVSSSHISAWVERSGADGTPTTAQSLFVEFSSLNNMGLDAAGTCLPEDKAYSHLETVYFSTELNDDIYPIEFKEGDLLVDRSEKPYNEVIATNFYLTGFDSKDWGLDAVDLHPERFEEKPQDTPTTQPKPMPTLTPTISTDQKNCVKASDYYTSIIENLDSVELGLVAIKSAISASGSPLGLSIRDCSEDGLMDVWVSSSELSYSNPAAIIMSASICAGNAPSMVEVTLRQYYQCKLIAYDDNGTVVDSVDAAVGSAEQTLTLTSATGIRVIELIGAEICITKICWECEPIVKPTPTKQIVESTPTLPIEEKDCVQASDIYTSDMDNLDSVELGLVSIKSAISASGSPLGLSVRDCSEDGLMDVWVSSSELSYGSLASIIMSPNICNGNAPSMVEVYLQHFYQCKLIAYDDGGTVVDTVDAAPDSTPQILTLTSATGIRMIEIIGAEICITKICWECELIVKPTPTKQIVEPTPTLPIEEKDCVQASDIYTSDMDNLDSVELGLVSIKSAISASGSPLGLSVRDCSEDGLMDVWVSSSELSYSNPAAIIMSASICAGNAPSMVEVTLRQYYQCKLIAYDDNGTVVDSVDAAVGSAEQTLTLTSATGIRVIELIGAEICITKICWECEPIVKPTPTKQIVESTPTLPIEEKDCVQASDIYTSDMDNLDSVELGLVSIKSAISASGSPLGLSIRDCSEDGLMDVWVSSSDPSYGSLASIIMSPNICNGKASSMVEVYLQHFYQCKLIAYDDGGTVVDTVDAAPDSTPQILTLTSATGIRMIEIIGAEICITKICWECELIVKPTPTKQIVEPTPTLPIEEKDCVKASDFYASAVENLNSVDLGSVSIKPAIEITGAIFGLSVRDCSEDGLMDVWVSSSEASYSSPAAIVMSSDICAGKAPSIVEVTLRHYFECKLVAYDDAGTVVDSVFAAAGSAEQTLTLTSATGIRVIEIIGAEICITEICWECEPIDKPTPTATPPEGDEGLTPDDGITFNQVDFMFEKSQWQNSSWGRISINPYILTRNTKISRGYLNVYTDKGWHVVNLPINADNLTSADTQRTDLVTYFNLGIVDPAEIKDKSDDEIKSILLEKSYQLTSFVAHVTFTQEPIVKRVLGQLVSFPIEENIIWDAQGVSDITISAFHLPPFIITDISDIILDSIFSYHTQPQSANVETANNQCFPMAIANSLQYLENEFSLSVPHDHVMGLKGDNSLVGQLDSYANRSVSSRRSGSGTWFTPMIDGKFKYLSDNNLSGDLIHKYQGRGWGSPPNQALPAGDYTSNGSTIKDEGAVVTFDWICQQIQEGEDVELVFSYDDASGNATGGHAVRVFECGNVLGKPYIKYLHDSNQSNDSAGLETVQVFLEDLDGDGILNLGSASREIRFAMAESMKEDTILINPNMGLMLEQVIFTFDETQQIVSNWGRLVIDPYALQKNLGVERGFINVYNDNGWLVMNLPLDTSSADADSKLVTYFNLGLQDGEQIELVKSMAIHAEFSVKPVDKTPMDQDGKLILSTFELRNPAIWDAQGISDNENPSISLAPPYIINKDIIFTSLFEKHTQEHTSNVQTAHNQCFPMAVANSLQYLENEFGLSVPNDHVMGLKGDNSLVGKLDSYANRSVSSRRSGSGTWFTPMIDGKFKYLSENNLSGDLIHKYQGRGWGSPPNQALPAGDYTAHGITIKDEGAVVTIDWICQQIKDGEDVELVFSYDDASGNATGGHAVRVYECGKILGKPYIKYLHDSNQSDDSAGLETVLVYPEDLDGDGILNLGSASREIRFAMAESFVSEIDNTPTPIAPTPTKIITKPTPTPVITKPTPTPVITKPTPTSMITKPTPTPVITKPTPTSMITKPTPTPVITKPTPTPTFWYSGNPVYDDLVISQGFGGETLINIRYYNEITDSLTSIRHSFIGAPGGFISRVGGGTGRMTYLSVGDLNGDGTEDIITSFGPIVEESVFPNIVVVRDSKTKQVIGNSFVAFPVGDKTSVQLNSGDVRTAVGDFIGSGLPQLAVTQGQGGNGIIRLYQYTNKLPPNSWEVVGQFNGLPLGLVEQKVLDDTTYIGLTLAAGDLDQDGFDELVVGQSNGPASQTIFHVLDINSDGGIAKRNIYAGFKPQFRAHGGIELAVGDLNGDKYPEIIVGNMGNLRNFGDQRDTVPLNLVGIISPVITDKQITGFRRPAGKSVFNAFSNEDNPSGAISMTVGEFDGNPINGKELVIGTGAYMDIEGMNTNYLHPADVPRYKIMKVEYEEETIRNIKILGPTKGYVAFLGKAVPSSKSIYLAAIPKFVIPDLINTPTPTPTATPVKPSVGFTVPGKPLFVGSYAKIPVEITPALFTIDEFDFFVQEGPKGGAVSISKDEDFDPLNPDIMLLAGYQPGTYKLQAKHTSTGIIVGEKQFEVTDLWKGETEGPAVWFTGLNQNGYAGSAWGGGPAGPQNINIKPATGTRRVAILLVDTSSERYSNDNAIIQGHKDRWLNEAINGVNDGGKTYSVSHFYREVSYNNFTLTGQVFGPVSLTGEFKDYINPDGSPKGSYYQSCFTAGDSLINYNNFDTLVCVSKSVIASGSSAWPYASIGEWGPFTTAEGKVNYGCISMPNEWGTTSAREIYETLSHEMGHNLGLGDMYTPKVAMPNSPPTYRNLEDWDMMDDDNIFPHFSVMHRMMLGWVPASWLQTFNFANGGVPINQTISLHPIELGAPPAGKKTAVEIRIADGWNYYFEYRSKQAAQIADQGVPGNGRILGSDGVSAPWVPPIARPYILLLNNDADGDGSVLDNGDDYKETDFSDPAYPTDFMVEASGIDGSKGDITIKYGVNGKPDPSIRPWPASADRRYQSPDIEVQNTRNLADAAWFNVPWINHSNTIIAKVKNRGTLNAPGVTVNFYIKNFNVGGAPETYLGTSTKDIAAGATVDFTYPSWVPPSGGHYCIIVRIPLYQNPNDPTVVEMTELNNMAQSNYDRFISATASPAKRVISFVEVGNPYDETSRVFVTAGQSNPFYRTYLEHAWLVLKPNETKKVRVMFEYATDALDSAGIDFQDDWTKHQRLPNNVDFASFVDYPRDFPRHAKHESGGVQVQVVTGRATKIIGMEIGKERAYGSVVTVDNGTGVFGGKVILILTVKVNNEDKEVYEEAQVDAQGHFSASITTLNWERLQVYYVPSSGYADSYSDVISSP